MAWIPVSLSKCITPIDTRSEQQPETEGEMSLANEYLPSAMGDKCPCRVLHSSVRDSEGRRIPEGEGTGLRSTLSHNTILPWFRVPFTSEILFTASWSLCGSGIVTLKEKFWWIIGPVGWHGQFVSRPSLCSVTTDTRHRDPRFLYGTPPPLQLRNHGINRPTCFLLSISPSANLCYIQARTIWSASSEEKHTCRFQSLTALQID